MARVNVMSNPKRRPSKRRAPAKKRTTRAITKRRASAPAKRRAPVKRRRNPARRKNDVIGNNIMPSVKAAAGAVLIDGAYSQLPIPAQYQSGVMGNVVKALVSVGLGMAAEKTKVIKADTARDMVNGALTVQVHAIMQESIGGMIAGQAVTSQPATGTGTDTATDTGTVQGLGYAGTSRRVGVAPRPLARTLGGYQNLAGYNHM